MLRERCARCKSRVYVDPDEQHPGLTRVVCFAGHTIRYERQRRVTPVPAPYPVEDPPSEESLVIYA